MSRQCTMSTAELAAGPPSLVSLCSWYPSNTAAITACSWSHAPAALNMPYIAAWLNAAADHTQPQTPHLHACGSQC